MSCIQKTYHGEKYIFSEMKMFRYKIVQDHSQIVPTLTIHLLWILLTCVEITKTYRKGGN